MSNVRDFGATGDGQTDDTESIRHVIEHGDGPLFFRQATIESHKRSSWSSRGRAVSHWMARWELQSC